MADVLIKGLDMPTKGNPLTVLIYPDGTATWKGHEYQAVPIPPHGRMGDLDLILKRISETCKGVYGKESIPEESALFVAAYFVETAPTIISADPEGGVDG